MRIKGTMIMDYARIIRADKGKDWDRHLKPEDWEIINAQVLPSNWYPYESFRRMGMAVFKEVANSNLDMVRSFGRFTIKNQLKIYKQIVVPGDPAASVEKVAKLRKTFVDAESDTTVIEQGEGWLKYRIIIPPQEKDPEGIKAFGYQVAGNLEEIVEQAGGKKVSTKIEFKGKECEILVQWE